MGVRSFKTGISKRAIKQFLDWYDKLEFWFLLYFVKNKLDALSSAVSTQILLFLLFFSLTLSEFNLIFKVLAVEEVICNAQGSFSSKADLDTLENLIFPRDKQS